MISLITKPIGMALGGPGGGSVANTLGDVTVLRHVLLRVPHGPSLGWNRYVAGMSPVG